jgi:hypothetical protein
MQHIPERSFRSAATFHDNPLKRKPVRAVTIVTHGRIPTTQLARADP